MSLIQDFVDMVLRGKTPRKVIDAALELDESYHGIGIDHVSSVWH